MESTQPLLVEISDERNTLVHSWQLIGEWPTGRSPQHIAFNAFVPEGEKTLDLHLRLKRGACYHSDDSGGVAWSLGWVYDPRLERWVVLRPEYLPENVSPDSTSGMWHTEREKWLPAEDTEELYGPKLRLHKIVAWKSSVL